MTSCARALKYEYNIDVMSDDDAGPSSWIDHCEIPRERSIDSPLILPSRHATRALPFRFRKHGTTIILILHSILRRRLPGKRSMHSTNVPDTSQVRDIWIYHWNVSRMYPLDICAAWRAK